MKYETSGLKFPQINADIFKNYPHLSAEGQSDYWAAAVCLKKVFSQLEKSDLKTENLIHSFVKNNCVQEFSEFKDQKLCYRIAQAGFDFMTELHLSLQGVIQNDPSGFYSQPDFSRHETLFAERYPTLQCHADKPIQTLPAFVPYYINQRFLIRM